jgi:hypothetical protein
MLEIQVIREEIIRLNVKEVNFTQLTCKYRIFDDMIIKKINKRWKIIVTKSLVYDLIIGCHEYLHCGSDKCISTLKETFTLKNM